MAHPGGRPTTFDLKYVDELYTYLDEATEENMDLPTVEGFALRIGASKDTLYTWAKIHKEFSDALKDLKYRQKQELVKIGIFGGKEINSNIVMLMLKVNHKMIETTKQDITSKGEKIESNAIVFSNFKHGAKS
jgi:hypothetical protein